MRSKGLIGPLKVSLPNPLAITLLFSMVNLCLSPLSIVKRVRFSCFVISYTYDLKYRISTWIAALQFSILDRLH